MAERITSITMQAFRGIPESFTLDLGDRRSCVILGDNGTGKSSIADAVEWYFTGRVEFLTKEGRSDAIRHSGAPEDLDTKIVVSTDGSLGGEITRSSSPGENVREVGRADLFLLRGRTLAEFVDKTKGEKWRALSELLGFEAIDRLRLDLQTVKNELEDHTRDADRELAQRRSALVASVGEISEQGILTEIHRQCAIAGLTAPATLDAALRPEWAEGLAPKGSQVSAAGALRALAGQLRTEGGAAPRLDPLREWNEFVAQGEKDQRPLGLFRAADALLQSKVAHADRCPLCGQAVDLNRLATRVASELQELQDAAQALGSARSAAQRFVGDIRDAHSRRREISRVALRNGVELASVPSSPDAALASHIESVSEMDNEDVRSFLKDLLTWDADALGTIESQIPPPSTEREQALVQLGVIATEARAWRQAVASCGQTRVAFELADQIFKKSQNRLLRYVNEAIETVSSRVAEIYQLLHPEGGIGEVALETVGEKGAELAVEFHGHREIPPHRVLSESHLNSLGIALFLAMAESFNEKLGFLVLDDVVNSFDREHRGRLADLLVDEFEGTQLIVLTHDELFFTQLSRRAPAWTRTEFTSWLYEAGPRTRESHSARALERAQEAIDEGDRVVAAQQGRRALEEFLQEACETLEALLPFRRGYRNDRRTAEEVLKGFRRTVRRHSRPLYDQMSSFFGHIESDLQASLNVESHANQAGSSDQEVNDALSRISRLSEDFTCKTCETRVWHAGSSPAWRCRCGRSQFPPPVATPGENAQQQ
ncbi:MAG: AAA family ATPase [Chloroflexi bacterium]|nr:AAA family ATPase [Chloroflexota bacterium]